MRCVPNHLGVDALCGQHCENDGQGETDRARAGQDRYDCPKPDQPRHQRDDKNVDHGPSADEFDQFVQDQSGMGAEVPPVVDAEHQKSDDGEF